MKLLTALLLLSASVFAQSPAPNQPKTTGVFVMLTVKQGVTRDQIMAVMPNEVRDTVRMYLAGKIREWYSRSDGKGVVFLEDAKDEAEAKALMESLPLAKENLMDYQYLAVGPLMPLAALIAAPAK